MDDKGEIFYFNRVQRLEFKKNNSNNYVNDSHASICDYYKLNEDEVNKYEYTKSLIEDSKCFDLSKENQKTMDDFISNLDLREFVINSYVAYWYCDKIKDDPEVRKLITESGDAYFYCRDIKDDPEVRKLITDSYDAYKYCCNVKDKPEMRKLITTSFSAYLYCRDVKDRPEIRKLIKQKDFGLNI